MLKCQSLKITDSSIFSQTHLNRIFLHYTLYAFANVYVYIWNMYLRTSGTNNAEIYISFLFTYYINFLLIQYWFGVPSVCLSISLCSLYYIYSAWHKWLAGVRCFVVNKFKRCTLQTRPPAHPYALLAYILCILHDTRLLV